jgi:hypothetical protein
MKKLFLSILIILLTISFVSWVIYLNRKPTPVQSPVTEDTIKEKLPAPEQPPASETVIKEQQQIPQDIKKGKLPVSPKMKNKQEPVKEEVTQKQGAVPEEIKEEKAPLPEEIKKEKAPVPEKSPKEISKLQAKCEKRCQKIFSKEYKGGTVENSKGAFLYKYKSHYNKKLDKCLMVITEDGVLERYKKLLDVDENNSYGSVRVNNEQENLGCYVLEKKCNSEQEWDLIVKSYMEE